MRDQIGFKSTLDIICSLIFLSIPLEFVCDGQSDCIDDFDETSCEYIIVRKGYKKIPPPYGKIIL